MIDWVCAINSVAASGDQTAKRRLSAFDDAVMSHFVDHLSRDFQPKGCDVTVLNYARRRHTCERVPNA